MRGHRGTFRRNIEYLKVTKAAETQEKLRTMNEALVLGSVRQHELTEAAETLNARLREEIAERKRAEIVVNAQRQALQLLAEGATLAEMLEYLIGVVERHSPQGVLASIVLLNEAGTHFERGIGASLPEAFNAAFEGVAVNSPTDLSADAVTRRGPVAVSDFSKAARWQAFGEFGAPYGLHSGWSTPIFSSSGRVLGTFANYYPHAGDPTPQNRELVHVVVRTAAIAIERKRSEKALRESEDRYRNLFNSMDEGYCIIEVIFDKFEKPVDYRFLEVNRAFDKQSGMHDVAGKRMLEFVTEIEEHWLVNYGKVALTGEPARFENEYKSLDRWFDVYAFKIGGPESRRVAVLFTDITERKRADEAHARLAAIVESSDDAIVSKDLNGVITSWNAGAERLFGYTAQEAIGQPVTMLIPRDRLGEEPGILERIRRRESIEHYETVRRRKDGSSFDVSLTVSPLVDRLGNVVGASKIARDITERKQAEQRQRLLMNELAHRGRNLMAVVQSIASLTMSGAKSLVEARAALTSRIQALARSQTVLMSDGFEFAPLAEIIRLEISAFSSRVSADGPDVLLKPKIAQTFALIVHELATNATKHGALSQPDGRVSIQWTVDDTAAEPDFCFQWQERGGPPAKPPTREGFGRMLLEKVAAQDFGAPPKISFGPEGLGYEIRVPLAAVAADAPNEQSGGWLKVD